MIYSIDTRQFQAHLLLNNCALAAMNDKADRRYCKNTEWKRWMRDVEDAFDAHTHAENTRAASCTPLIE